MDPVTAIGLATNVVQLVEISWRVVSKSNEIYRHGTLLENRDTATVTADLQNVNERVLEFLREAEKDQDLTEEDEALRRLCESSNQIATDLIKRLKTIKTGDGYQTWKSIRSALKSVWTKAELDRTALRLQAYRSQLNTRVLVSLREKIDRVDQNTKSIVSSLRESMALLTLNQEIQTQYLTRLITSQHEKTRGLLDVISGQPLTPRNPAPSFGAHLETKNGEGSSALCHFAQRGDIAAVSSLLDQGADIETVGQKDQTPLVEAAC